MSGPRVAIVLELEASPRVYVDVSSHEEEQRLLHWLRSSGYWRRLVELAIELAEERAA